MTLEEILKAIEIARKLITIVGDVTLSESVTWLETKANSERLRLEGHEVPPAEKPAEVSGIFEPPAPEEPEV